MELLLATGNPHKREEFARIFQGHRIILPVDRGISFDYEEKGHSFLENALDKARALRELCPFPGEGGPLIIADDSGLAVEALDGAPGIYSARFGSANGKKVLSDHQRNLYLLEKMQGIEDRRASFVCALVLLVDEHRFFVAQESLEGQLGLNPRGEGGFGYDPLLYLPEQGMTVAQLPPDKKDRLSHRGKAARAIGTIIDTYLQGGRTL